MRTAEIAIIGGGPAGLAAALAAHEAGAKEILILERDAKLGGILQQCIHNGFGLHYFKQELTGPEYAARFEERLLGTSITVLTETMVLELSKDRVVTAVSAKEGFLQIKAKAIILAMGCRERSRGALLIPGTRPAGVYTAGLAQRLVNMEGLLPGKEIVILGSGDIGLIMARRMTWEGAKVKMVCELMPYSSGLTRNIVQCLEDNDIPLYFNTTVVEIHGRERLAGVTIAKVDEQTKKPIPGTEKFVPCDTLLLSVGLIPENELSLQAGIEMDPVTGGARVSQERQTSLPGVFACGNVLHVHDLVDNVSEEAEIAGAAAARFAKGEEGQQGREIPVRAEGGVRYVVPQRVLAREGEELTFYFRVGATHRPAQLCVLSGDEQLLSRRKAIMTPGEMESVTVRLAKLGDEIILRVENA
ncbi:MAG: FAD-dependent oxidoreductase [Christensenellaceae bacterium]|jgi:NADPH-dependent 2,4-dienoyl-CoA reductase/sulfur reductase-like enzyme|nr:FAD-dependent oxidoreductase [Christensenellaceae bacterium]